MFEATGALIFFILGTIIGSFLNVVILRHNTGRTVQGRSGCFSCGKTLQWFELVPVLSFLIQGGRCRACKARLSWQYPLVEVATGILFAGVFLKLSSDFFAVITTFHPVPVTLFTLIIMSLLIVISVYDVKHFIIPNAFVYPLIAFSSVSLFVDFPTLTFVTPTFWHLAAGPLAALPFAFLWAVSKGQWMGLGDAKLAWPVGWLLGLEGAASALVLAFWTGALYALAALAYERLFSHRQGLTMKSEIPFGPFIVLGFLLVFFFNVNILDFTFLIF